MSSFRTMVLLILIIGMVMNSTTAYGQVTKTQLANGLKVLMKEDHKAPVVAIVTWVNTGYFNEPDSLTGISHLLEHMFFKGTPKRGVGQIALDTKAAGGYLNAGTSYEQTSYYTVLPSESFLKGLDIQSDALQNCLIDSAELAKEAKVVIQEIKRKFDNPSAYSYEKLLELAFDKHRVRRWRMGTESQVGSWPQTKVRDYYHAGYLPENIIVAIVGDIDTATALSAVKKYYDKMPSGNLQLEQSPAEPSQVAFKYERLTADINSNMVYAGFHVPGILSDDYYPLIVLDYILSGGRSSRLYQELKEKQELADDVNSTYDSYKDFGYFTAFAEQASGDPQKLTIALFEQLERFKISKITQTELQRAQNQLESGYLHRLEDVNGQALNLAQYEFYGDYRMADGYLDRLRAVTAEDIQRVANKYFTVEKASVLEYLPRGKEFKTCGKDEMLQSVSESLKQYRQHFHASNYDDVPFIVTSQPVGGQAIPDQKVNKLVLNNGITVICKENHSLPLVSVSAYFGGGSCQETPANAGVTRLMVKVALKGAGTMTALDIASDIEGLGSSIGYDVDNDYFGFHFESMSKNFEEGFGMLSQVVLEPTFLETEMQKEKKDLIASIQRFKDSTSDYPLELCQQSLYEGTPYGLPSLGDSASIEQLTVADLFNRHRRAVVSNNLVITFVGDITSAQALELTRRYFNRMNVAPKTILPTIPKINKAFKARIEKRDKAQTAQAFAIPTCAANDSDFEPLKVCQNILSGMGGRLYDKIREQNSLAYTIYVYQEGKAMAGDFVCYMATSPENEKKARQMALETIANLKTEEPGAEELSAAKNYTIGSFEINLQANSSLAALLARWELVGRGYEAVDLYPDRIRNVSADMVVNVAAKYFSAKHYGLGMIEGKKPVQTGK